MEPRSGVAAFSLWEPGSLALLAYAVIAAVLVGLLLFMAGWLGEKKKGPEKLRPFESGIIPTGSARFPYPIPFYLIAAFFLIFDVEAVFIYSWAIAFDRLAWAGWLQMTFFIVVLLVSLFYIWKKGGLEWGPTSRKKPSPPATSS